MKLSDLRPAAGSRKQERRVGRGHGSGRVKTSGRGTKGQKARTGSSVHASFQGGQTRLAQRQAFRRGLGNSNIPFRKDFAIVNVAALETFEAGSHVTPELLAEQGMISRTESKGLVKILGDGELDHALTIRAHKFSESARAKIEAAGGTIEVIPMKVTEKTKRRKDESGKRVPPPKYG